MRRVRVDSRALKSIGYEADARLLEVEFASGKISYRAFMHAKSKGHFFQTSIDRKFKFEEVK
jgi:KTSC domain